MPSIFTPKPKLLQLEWCALFRILGCALFGISLAFTICHLVSLFSVLTLVHSDTRTEVMNVDSLTFAQKSLFIRWRWSVFLSMFLGWSCIILIRKNLPSSMASLIQHQGFTHNDVGMITSCFAVSYGFSKFFGSVVSDHASPQKVFMCGLVLAGICSLVFPLASNVMLACIVWFAEGIAQGFGWPPCVILLKSWYPPSHIGRWWSVLSSAGNIASAALPLLVIFITSLSHWSMSYYLFGMFGIGMGITIVFTIRDSPEDVGLTAFHQPIHKTDTRELKENWYSVFFIFNLWVVSFLYVNLYTLNHVMLNWAQLYFVQEARMSQAMAAACYSIFQVGAVAGNLTSGYISDLFITPKTSKCPCPRSPFLLSLSVMLVVFFHLLRTTVDMDSSKSWVTLLLFMIGFLSSSGVVVVGLSSMEVVPRHMVGSAHGLVCAVAQVGAFAAGWPFTLVLERYGWNTAYGVVEGCLIIMVGISSYLLLLLVKEIRKHNKLV